MNEKKKWLDTWWGLLWVLAISDMNMGRGCKIIQEITKDFEEETNDSKKEANE